MSHNYENILRADGWVEFNDIPSIQSVVCLAREFGEIIPHPDGKDFNIVTPKQKNAAYPGTLSNLHGFDEFPLHTDTAFWPVPARYLVLAMLNKNSYSSNVVNANKVFESLDHDVRKAARDAVFKVHTPLGDFDASAIFEESGEIGFRFNACCMTPANVTAKSFLVAFDHALRCTTPNTLQWTGSKAVIIDNWKVLHGRSAIRDFLTERKLIRIYVK
ncbi:MAG: hypothetical protein OEZ58_08765 [Gammaproteobacteria bacterium]|nr:hypothetical protein [Gammaproteobacteria bacterium]MDH5729069.1 hypothetical protein [Gammaproteobacteria bacterium]